MYDDTVTPEMNGIIAENASRVLYQHRPKYLTLSMLRTSVGQLMENNKKVKGLKETLDIMEEEQLVHSGTGPSFSHVYVPKLPLQKKGAIFTALARSHDIVYKLKKQSKALAKHVSKYVDPKLPKKAEKRKLIDDFLPDEKFPPDLIDKNRKKKGR